MSIELPKGWQWRECGRWDRRGYLWRAEKTGPPLLFADAFSSSVKSHEQAIAKLIAMILDHEAQKEPHHA